MYNYLTNKMYKFRVFFGFPQDNVYTDIELPVIPAKDETIILREEELKELHTKITKKSEFLSDWLRDYGKMSQKEFIDLVEEYKHNFFQVMYKSYVSSEQKIRIMFHRRVFIRDESNNIGISYN